ncbi:hypothetical protein A3K48_00110 [candidate division WOR-1 bacterium RIFOXYA12_FULL_52_29]|uniref:Uncharacterized protein n=1 Tax=candidate division WOR-1 bacterium RIFOXYC12_FULL_54_18 TaxID=1802584 RepID=A0A1F4T4F0_UNCSA|nr:MAG: hypothetical protein A3K44_00110 [candidate division WOR-1 bacterium RIFOXYA2_FULL_51_19]OGC17010.1 MAG: hypothetical protein A3K48_00110 [candidate division WOR-1 bacterium RIFOXYA12_FULL_52_29]OGC25871.1 MAG: hypothetical protein A3K32_00110 [candidate division WOR-1 bacterium RIFOXYB2_FULL_45_9]OGC27427.1 MAG: hypothetical protein A3K49_00110 [candidate division WOR-1 bacterium RIFOXYC12_FULL_54_18]OGC29360.1 MAG: hypothetical protein A2346_01595 [candidate division WOR-1 bacterium R
MAISVIGLIFGILLLWNGWLLRLIEQLDKPVMVLDEKALQYRIICGLVLLIVSIVLLAEAVVYPDLIFFYVPGVFLVIVCFLLLFLPGTLARLCELLDTVVMPVDGLVLGMRKLIGALLIIAAGYIFYLVYASGAK